MVVITKSTLVTITVVCLVPEIIPMDHNAHTLLLDKVTNAIVTVAITKRIQVTIIVVILVLGIIPMDHDAHTLL